MGSADGFIGVIGQISTLVGFGMQLKSIFGGSAPLTIADIQTAVRQEVTAALSAQALEDEIISASATLQSVQEFLTTEYVNAVTNGMDRAGIAALLTNTTIGPLVADMVRDAHALRTWMDQSDLKTAAKGISVSLGLYLYLATVHRERATFAESDAEKQSELANMRSYARDGVQDIAPRLIELMNVRMASLNHLVDDNPNIYGIGYCVIDSLHDTWIDTWLFAFKMRDDDTQDYAEALRWVMRATRNLLWSGAQADADEFTRSLTDGWLRLPGRVPPLMPLGLTVQVPAWADNFHNTCLIPNTNFGKLVQGARTALLGLDAIAVGYSGSEQDNWSWCSSCGGLYYAGWTSFCPATKGPHVHEQPSSNYALRCSPTGPSVHSMQGDWRWCKKCSGLFQAGPRRCAAGGEHDPSGSGLYELDVGAAPGLDVLGLPNAQDNWRWCSKCSLLHFGSGPNVCPTGGGHDSSGSGNYWLSTLGTLPQRL